MKVTLREKEGTKGDISLYLDIYQKGQKRKYEFLDLKLIPNPKTTAQKNQNKETRNTAEAIRAKRQIELQNGTYGLSSQFKENTDFIAYFQEMIEKRKESKGNFGNWKSCLIHLNNYTNSKAITFKDIDTKFVEGFKQFLLTTPNKNEKPLSNNAALSYFNKFRAVLNQAFEEGIIAKNPIKGVKTIKSQETLREYLTATELRTLVQTECKYVILKRAFLFSCLTGIRWSDIQKLTWGEIQDEKETPKIVFMQKKTKGLQYLDIQQQARDMLGERKDSNERVFVGLKYNAWYNMQLQKWVMEAGIKKTITFHCARHTFAVLLLENDVDIFTVSKLLGHSELKTTQIYAKVLDKAKQTSINKLPQIFI